MMRPNDPKKNKGRRCHVFSFQYFAEMILRLSYTKCIGENIKCSLTWLNNLDQVKYRFVLMQLV
jgi:hypothetical protein